MIDQVVKQHSGEKALSLGLVSPVLPPEISTGKQERSTSETTN